MLISDERKRSIERKGALRKRCPQFDTCSVQACPLDPRYPDVKTDEGAPECTARLATRLRIVAQALREGLPAAKALRYGGRTRQEHAAQQQRERGRQQWDALLEEEKEKRLAALRRGREELHKGGQSPQC